ncbi:MAG: peptidylprolyl isomerase [Eggerthellaceae bacterium]|nr:peptidylprolyl isomerase [Eggerthellaceae bacterium]
MIGKYAYVRVAYTGYLEDGTVFDSSEQSGPLEFQTDCGQVIKGLDDAVQVLEVGQKERVRIPCEFAYGPYDERNVQKRDLRYIPNAEELPVGQTISFFGPVGQKVPAKVLKVEDGFAYLDFNHRLAGKDLIFDVEVLEILPPKTRRTPLSAYGAMGRTADTQPVAEQPVFNNFLMNMGLTEEDVDKAAERLGLGDEAASGEER